jgi:hypothetical protein
MGVTCADTCKVMSFGPVPIPFDYCVQHMCPKGRELDEYTPEVASAKTAPASYEGKIKFKKKIFMGSYPRVKFSSESLFCARLF